MGTQKYQKRQAKFDAIKFIGGEKNGKDVTKWLHEVAGQRGMAWTRNVPGEFTAVEEWISIGSRRWGTNTWFTVDDIHGEFTVFSDEEFQNFFVSTEDAVRVTTNNFYATDNANLKFTPEGIEPAKVDEELKVSDIWPPKYFAQTIKFGKRYFRMPSVGLLEEITVDDIPEGAMIFPVDDSKLHDKNFVQSIRYLTEDGWKEAVAQQETPLEKFELDGLFSLGGVLHGRRQDNGEFVPIVIRDDKPTLIDNAGDKPGLEVNVTGGIIKDVTQYSEDTLFKVMRALMDCRIGQPQAEELIQSMQNSGILFRERV